MPLQTPHMAVHGTTPEPGVEGSVYPRLKAAADWVCAAMLLIAALPLMLVVAAAVTITSRGPVFYSQMRLGKGGAAFLIFKFRTMTHRCESTTGPVWSISNDPRVTPIGRWLRGTHIDELPQLWNVLRGEMSLIGPRPERPEIVATIERVLPEFRRRLCVRPGLSGLAQVIMPPDANLQTVQNKLAHDLEYIRNMGPLLDVRIGFATVLCLAGVGPAVTRRLLSDVCPAALEPVVDRALPPMTVGVVGPVTVETEREPLAA